MSPNDSDLCSVQDFQDPNKHPCSMAVSFEVGIPVEGLLCSFSLKKKCDSSRLKGAKLIKDARGKMRKVIFQNIPN